MSEDRPILIDQGNGKVYRRYRTTARLALRYKEQPAFYLFNDGMCEMVATEITVIDYPWGDGKCGTIRGGSVDRHYKYGFTFDPDGDRDTEVFAYFEEEQEVEMAVTKQDCKGCYNDVYNEGDGRCWKMDNASLVERRKVPVRQRPPWNSIPLQVVPNCYNQRGYAFMRADA